MRRFRLGSGLTRRFCERSKVVGNFYRHIAMDEKATGQPETGPHPVPQSVRFVFAKRRNVFPSIARTIQVPHRPVVKGSGTPAEIASKRSGDPSFT